MSSKIDDGSPGAAWRTYHTHRAVRETGETMRNSTWAAIAVLAAGMAASGAAAQDPARDGGARRERPGTEDSLAQAQLVIDVSAIGEEASVGGRRFGEVRAGRLRQGQSKRFSVTLSPGQCVLVVARAAAPIENVDVAIARGRTELARDTSTDTSADARYCAGERRERVRWSVTAFRGTGTFAAGAFEVPATAPGGGEAATAESGGSLLERLAARATELASGMQPVTTAARLSIREGARIEADVPITAGRCYRVVTASEGIADLDLALVAPGGGGLVQEDGTDDGNPTLGVLRPLCPAQPGNYRVVARAERGGGAFAWQVLGAAPAGPRGGQQARTARFRIGGAGSDFVAQRIRAKHGEVGGGRQPITDLITGTLATSERRAVSIDVQGGRCYVAIAAGVPSVRELDVRIVDPFGHEHARDETRDALPSARACPSVAGTWSVEVRMHNGYGRYGLQVFEGAR